MQTHDAVIIGGGIGGLALGCFLAKNNHSVIVVETRAGLLPSKRGLSLQANGMGVLERMGLLDKVMDIGVATRHVEWYDLGGELLADLDYSVLDHPFNYLLTVVPSELERILRDEFVRRGGILSESTLFEGFTREPDQITIRARKDGLSLEFSGKLMVGADGENSRVREALQLRTIIRECQDHFLFMLVGSVEAIRQAARQYVGRGKMFGLYPVPDGTYVFYYVPRGLINSLKANRLESFKTELSRITPEIRDALGRLRSWDDIVYVAPKRIDVQDWVADRAALLGDAVHALDPSWAQGANLTLQDAEVLGETIERCFDSEDFTADKLKEYEALRKKHSRFVQQQSDRTARLSATQSRLYHWMGKRIIRRTGQSRVLMRTAIGASAGIVDHFSLLEQLRFIL